MKKSNIFGMILFMLSMAIPAMGAMSTNDIRKNSRFLTDRMAYELNLNTMQYEDAYEINYDFLYNVRYLLDDVAREIPRAIDKYYEYLDIRNDDLRWILSETQYRRFITEDYFYRPVYAQKNRWQLRIYFVYTNINFFYFDRPRHYTSYRGGHFRTYHNNISFYQQRYNKRYKHDVFKGNYSIRNNQKRYEENKKYDFGSNSRPSASKPGNNKPTTNRPNNNNSSTSRPSSNSSSTSKPETTRPSTSRPSSNSSSTSKPETTRPSTSRPSSNSSSTSKPETTRPSTSRPSSNSSSTSKPETTRPSTSRPSSNSSSTSKPETTRPSTSRPSSNSSSTSRSSSKAESNKSNSSRNSSKEDSRSNSRSSKTE